MLSRFDAISFVEILTSEAETIGIDTRGWIIDHVCFRTNSPEEYHRLTSDLLAGRIPDLTGYLLSNEEVNGRPILTMCLHEPLVVKRGLVEAIEIPAPKLGKSFKSGFEHIEVTITESFSDFINRHRLTNVEPVSGNTINPELALCLPSGRVKMHHLPLSCVIAIEHHEPMYAWLSNQKLLEKLKPWTPLVSGSIPLGVELPSSDLDILLYSNDVHQAAIEIGDVLSAINCPVVWQSASPSHGGKAKVGRISQSPRTIELFLSDTPVLKQSSHQHLLAEYLYLVKHGDILRDQVLTAKKQGKSTEESFAESLNLNDDPYTVMTAWPSPWNR